MFTLGELAERLGARVVGDADCVVSKVANLVDAGAGDITFLANPRFCRKLADVNASAVILAEKDLQHLRTNGLVVSNPHAAYARVAAWLYPAPVSAPGVHPSAIIHEQSQLHPEARVGPHCVVEAGAVLAAGCDIGPGCVIGANAVIGVDTRLHANVTISHGCRIGARVILHPGVVIGADGFGLAKDQGCWLKVPQVGGVVIGDDVEIGANTTVDRGALEDTIIGDGVKLDNLIQIGHNVRIDAHTAVSACTAIAGSAHIGAHCAIGGAVGIVGHLKIADNVTITGMSHVAKSITEPGVFSSGTPLEKNAQWHRNYVRMKQLDDMARRLGRLESRLREAEEGSASLGEQKK